MLRTLGLSRGPPGRPPSVQSGLKELTHATIAVVKHNNMQFSVLQTNLVR